MRLKVVAGAGSEPRMNFGDHRDVPVIIRKGWKNELKKHIGKQVYLTGGGGWEAHKVILDSVKEELGYDKKTYLRVYLSHVTPKIFGEDTFSPWVGSWQICVEEGPDCKGCKNECDSPNASLKDTMRRAEACRICVESGQRNKEVIQ